MASNFNLNTENEDNQREHLITITYTNKKCKKIPVMEKTEDFVTVYSPKALTLKPKDHCILNLHCNLSCNSEKLHPWLSLLPTLKCHGLRLKSKTVNKKNEIEVMLENESYYYTVEVKKHQALGYMFLLGLQSTDSFKTEYACIYE